VIVDTFDVLSPTEYFASPIEKFSFDILQGYTTIDPVGADLFVSPSGKNTNNGLTEDEPLKTIGYAFAKILADSLHPRTIHLLDGTYSRLNNNELYPLYMREYINISGTSPRGTVLDAKGETMVIMADSRMGLGISDLTITGGDGGISGAIYCYKTDLSLENVNVHENAALSGSAIHLYQSHSKITNCVISENQGYGIRCSWSSPKLTNVTISSNAASPGGFHGGGISCYRSHPVIINSILWNDSTVEIVSPFVWGGGLSSAVTIKYSDIQGGEEGIQFFSSDSVNWLEGSLDEDPLFVETGDFPYNISVGSPCIDAGTPDTTGLNLSLVDLIGNDRILDGDGDGVAIVDLVAYEFTGAAVGEEELQVDNLARELGGYSLQVFPNPTFRISDIRYHLPAGQAGISDIRFVSLGVYDLYGKEILSLVNKRQTAGEYTIRFNGPDLPAGIYLISLQAGEEVETVRMVIMN